MIIYKQKEEYWPRLQKGGKLNFLKVDFARWRDEDDSAEEEGQDPMGGMDFSSLMSQAGNMGLPNMDDLVRIYYEIKAKHTLTMKSFLACWG